MPSRICRFLAKCSEDERKKYLLVAGRFITNQVVLDIIAMFDASNPDKIKELELEFGKLLYVKGLQLEITDWILNAGNQHRV
jgi:hypothetical protein